MITKLLIANRGEIACRVIRSARSMGFATVAVYSEADEDAPHVALADEAVLIGPASASESYLDPQRVLAAARKTAADAIHPGYGFLSENADFARACEDAGVTFVGPPAEAIHLMGSKRLSKQAMQAAGVPCIPGYSGSDQDTERLLTEANAIGYPLMIKASAGGGGRGMRRIDAPEDLAAGIAAARSEGEKAFGSPELILEKAVIQPRHIEIQVFADQMGNIVYLGERDCSVQRRHQKVIEECPSPFVDEALRQRMGEAAVATARACDYVGAGTVEFLVDESGDFYFLEMNTRLQVEHPVTELVTGVDLVAWQLQVACGEPLPLTQAQICLKGHAMEARLYAEDPGNGFLPQTGEILRWEPASGDGIRIDDGIRQGQCISAHYDPMVAKLIGFGASREEARRRLLRAIGETRLLGVTSNQHFLAEIIRHPAFIAGEATTAFIEADFAENPSLKPSQPTPLVLALAAGILFSRNRITALSASPGQANSSQACSAPDSWSNGLPNAWPCVLGFGEEKLTLGILPRPAGGGQLAIHIDQGEIELRLTAMTPSSCCYAVDGVRRTVAYHLKENVIYLCLDEQVFHFEDLTHVPADTAESQGTGEIVANMDGAIVRILVKPGEAVTRGQPLVILEAMKMEHPLKADSAGIVRSCNVTEGQQVKSRQLLIAIDPQETTETEAAVS